MKYSFPVINTIQDVLPHIAGHDEFLVMEKEDYTVIDYVMQSSATFPNPNISDSGVTFSDLTSGAILRECRGLIFDKEGKLISRSFQKFFNYGEKPEEQKGLEEPVFALEKLDGSMIRPLKLHGAIRLATRKGVTDVAMQAEEFMADKPNYTRLIDFLVGMGNTPIFEWCSRKNQVVIDHPEEKLVLLAIRETTSGKYADYQSVINMGYLYGVPVVQHYDIKGKSLDTVISEVKGFTDSEGLVFVWPDGHLMKAKGDWYITLHRAKEAIGREKDLIKAYLTTGVDDILPILPEAYKQEVTEFLKTLTEEIINTAKHIDSVFANAIKDLPEKFTRKDFALKVQLLGPKYKSIMFNLLPGTSAVELVMKYVIDSCRSNKCLDDHRWMIGGIRFGEKKKEAA